MDVGILIDRCQIILSLLADFGTNVFDFLFSTVSLFGTDVVLVEVLFGGALITFLTVKIVAEFIT